MFLQNLRLGFFYLFDTSSYLLAELGQRQDSTRQVMSQISQRHKQDLVPLVFLIRSDPRRTSTSNLFIPS